MLRWLGVVAALVLLGGCRRDDGGRAVVDLWAMGREGEEVQRLLPDFERRHPDLRVRVQQIPWNAAHEKLLTAYVGDAMPDVVQLGTTWLPELVALGAVAPLDAWIAASSAVVPDDYFPGILATNVIDGQTYGVPWYVDTRLLFYRADLLAATGYAEPPRTWEGWRDAMTRLRRRAAPDDYAILLPITEWQPPVIFALQLGAELLRDGDRYGNFRSAPVRQALDFYLSLFDRGLAPRTGEAQVSNVYQEFARGYFAFYISGPWNVGEFARRLPAALQAQWATAPMPGPDAGRPGVSLAGGASLAVVRRSPRQAAAWRLVEYLSEPARQLEFFRLTGDLPARRSAWLDPSLAGNPRTRAFWEQLQHLRATPQIPEWEQIAAALSRYLEAMIRQSMPIDAALAALDQDVDALLEKRRFLLERSARH